MTFTGFHKEDFEVFQIEGLESRMEALIRLVRPKLHAIGEELAPYLTELCGAEMTPHVAKHARRSVNPPNDTWVAWAANKRGYKAHPHFQVGLWSTHVFIQFALIYECPNKASFARNMMRELDSVINHIPQNYIWSVDHMKPGGSEHKTLGEEQLMAMLNRMITVKKAELLCGVHIDRNDPLLHDGQSFIKKAEETFSTLLPLYRMGLES